MDGQKERKRVANYVATRHYKKRFYQGWTVMVNRRLLRGGDRCDPLGRSARRLLKHRLWEIELLTDAWMGTERKKQLRQVVIWLGVDDGHAPVCEYHPSKQWLEENGYNSDKAKCVEIGNAERFLALCWEQPGVVLHELAHALHHQVLDGGYENAEIRKQFDRVCEAKILSGPVMHRTGMRDRHYGCTDALEWFAEMSESYFSVGDFWPFTHQELVRADPESATFLRMIWGGREEQAAAPARCKVSFINKTKFVIELLWHNRIETTIQPGEIASRNTFAGHTFRARKQGKTKAFWEFIVAADQQPSLPVSIEICKKGKHSKK